MKIKAVCVKTATRKKTERRRVPLSLIKIRLMFSRQRGYQLIVMDWENTWLKMSWEQNRA